MDEFERLKQGNEALMKSIDDIDDLDFVRGIVLVLIEVNRRC